jgi:hypothetical protein
VYTHRNGKKGANLINQGFCCEYHADFCGRKSSNYAHITCVGHAINQINNIVDRYKKSNYKNIR